MAISPRRRRGFTLVELLVTVGIIIVLLAIALPILAKARKSATRTRISADLQTISGALEAYRQDFKDYPPVDLSNTDPIISTSNPTPQPDRIGAVALCWALLAPGPAVSTATAAGDGADGPGFRVRGTQGQVYGPYIQPGKFNITGTSDWDSTINDVRGNPYLYYRANPVANINTTGAYVGEYSPSAGGTVPMYNFYDNGNSATQVGITTNSHTFLIQDMQRILGADPSTGGVLVGGTPVTTAPYLLWSAGSDEIWGYDSSGNTDDVTNFSN